MRLPFNPILDTDSYKVSHWKQYPPGTDEIFAYLESRGGRHAQTLFFGLQYLLKRYFGTRITLDMVQEAQAFYARHFGRDDIFNWKGWTRIVKQHEGRLPLRIRAVPEGSIIPTHHVLMTVESTDPELTWLVSFFETQLLRVWYPTTVATLSWQIKQKIRQSLHRTASHPEAELPFKLHDFGSRGVSSQESAGIGGAAHLVNFQGSDTVHGIRVANQYYQAEMSGFSIPAAEHSTITSWGRKGEADAFRMLLNQFAQPNQVVAAVSDSYDLWNAIDTLWGRELKDQVIQSGGLVVIRPDSGNPVTIVKTCLERLANTFGTTLNEKGYRVLNHVRIIQGDGVTEETIIQILKTTEEEKFSTTNIAFGMGGALLQQNNRDTQKFAYKVSSIRIHGDYRDVSKTPITDLEKSSKAGKLDLVKTEEGQYETIRLPHGQTADPRSQLRLVYENGEFFHTQTFAEIRNRSEETVL